MDNIRLITILPATPEQLYDAWLSSHGHTAMTGGAPATTEPRVGARHTAWNGYISGEHIELEPPRRILQTWRTTEFPESAPDSLVEIVLLRDAGGTRLTLIQNGIPDGEGEKYHLGWQEHYFAPMRAHFEKTAPETPATKPAGGAKKAEAKSAKKKRGPVKAASPVKRAKVTPKAKAKAKKSKPVKAAAKPVKRAKRAATKRAATRPAATKPATRRKPVKKPARRNKK